MGFSIRYVKLFNTGTSGACYTNQTLCTVARLKETANPDNQIIARGCGPQNSYVKGQIKQIIKFDNLKCV